MTTMGGKRRHNARTQVRNSRGQFAPAHEVLVISDSEGDRLPLDLPRNGGGNSSKGKGPMTRAKAGKGAMDTLSVKKDAHDTASEDQSSSDVFVSDSDVEVSDDEELKWIFQQCETKAIATINYYAEKSSLKTENYAERAKLRGHDDFERFYEDIRSGKVGPPKYKAKKGSSKNK